jgi:hypothetical protein
MKLTAESDIGLGLEIFDVVVRVVSETVVSAIRFIQRVDADLLPMWYKTSKHYAWQGPDTLASLSHHLKIVCCQT